MLQVITSIEDIKQRIKTFKENQLSIGFVPTMGALHEGHLSLVRQARKENDKAVVSIFVNPLQFGINEDFTRYPKMFDNDCELLSKEDVDIVFNPKAAEMYPNGFCTSVIMEHLEDKLCGKSRPGHFRGVAAVVLKLFNLVKPDAAYFGQKDFQQTVVIKSMVADLNLDVNIKVLPTIRDKEGLALSSRNAYLSETEKNDALCLYKALIKAQTMANAGAKNAREITAEMEEIINNCKSAKIDYISIVNPETLEAVSEVQHGDVDALAVRIGKTRLIDNIILFFLLAVMWLSSYS
ncbi:MAG: pantoate--beta-alanine ligase [Candidatus Brocadiaceae bacterium]|uniref:pantoate--beta-alanine ligase n=1 Tax=Candidatus Wunengus sp. YC61 TaxID=3367698 RepID=UPI00271E0913|nr:pantoate--beta-alanine ligase [Candidatus Brocadiaceae bacterium]